MMSLTASPPDADVNATATALGVNAAFSGAGSLDTTFRIDEFVFDPSGLGPNGEVTSSTPFVQESLTLSLDFSGFLTGIDLENVDNGERLTISDGLTSQTLISFVDGLTPGANDLELPGTADAIATLPVPIAFSANQPLVFTVGGSLSLASGGASIGIQSISVQAIPSPAAVGIGLLGILGLAKNRRASGRNDS